MHDCNTRFGRTIAILGSVAWLHEFARLHDCNTRFGRTIAVLGSVAWLHEFFRLQATCQILPPWDPATSKLSVRHPDFPIYLRVGIAIGRQRGTARPLQ